MHDPLLKGSEVEEVSDSGPLTFLFSDGAAHRSCDRLLILELLARRGFHLVDV